MKIERRENWKPQTPWKSDGQLVSSLVSTIFGVNGEIGLDAIAAPLT